MQHDPDAADDSRSRFRVMVVCTGNICRSPAVEQVLAARFSRFGVHVSSAGTGALVDEPMPPQAQDMSRHLGGLPEAHRGRQVTRPLIEDADLVIALARDHRREIAKAVPRSSRYTFTLRELARLLESVVDDSAVESPATAGGAADLASALRALVPVVAGHRGFAPQPTDPKDDDVTDPFQRSQETYDRSEAQMRDALDRITESVETLAHRFGADVEVTR